jgi:hypothetical protein
MPIARELLRAEVVGEDEYDVWYTAGFATIPMSCAAY